MKISTKGRYGLRAMVDLAVHSMGDYVPLKHIAERQNISENYLEQVFSTLRKANLIRSIKGSQGGYALSKEASAITVGDILRALEGTLSVAEDKEAPSHGSIESCLSAHVWQQINKSINEVVDGITLEKLTDEHKKMSSDTLLMYYI